MCAVKFQSILRERFTQIRVHDEVLQKLLSYEDHSLKIVCTSGVPQESSLLLDVHVMLDVNIASSYGAVEDCTSSC